MNKIKKAAFIFTLLVSIASQSNASSASWKTKAVICGATTTLLGSLAVASGWLTHKCSKLASNDSNNHPVSDFASTAAKLVSVLLVVACAGTTASATVCGAATKYCLDQSKLCDSKKLTGQKKQHG